MRLSPHKIFSCRMPFVRSHNEVLQFFTMKCKLSNIPSGGHSLPAFDAFCNMAGTAHDIFKQATAFFKAYRLSLDEVPPVCHSTMIACIQQVTARLPKGARGRATELAAKMERFWKDKFCQIYPEKVNCIGKSRIKAIIADQMTDCLLVNATHSL